MLVDENWEKRNIVFKPEGEIFLELTLSRRLRLNRCEVLLIAVYSRSLEQCCISFTLIEVIKGYNAERNVFYSSASF